MLDEAKQFLDGSLDAESLLNSLEPRFPRLRDLASTPQEPEWHGEGDVRTHSIMVLNALREQVLPSEELEEFDRVSLVIGAALHDIGKAWTTKSKLLHGRERIVSPRHAEEGRSHVALRLGGGDLTAEMFERTLGIIGYHHHPRKLIGKTTSRGNYARVARSIPLQLLYLFEQADLRGRISAGLESHLEDLELFRLEAEHFGLWPDTEPYADWQQRLREELGVISESEMDYVVPAARFLYEQGKICTLEEAIGKTWNARKEHGRLILLCGPSGSGKSTWIEEFLVSHPTASVISLDEIREEIGGKRSKQSYNGRVVQIAKERYKESLRKKSLVIWDATNLRRDGRQALLQTAHDYGAATEIVRFAISPAELRRRNRKRVNDIPIAALERQLDRFQWPDLWEAQTVTTVFE